MKNKWVCHPIKELASLLRLRLMLMLINTVSLQALAQSHQIRFERINQGFSSVELPFSDRLLAFKTNKGFYGLVLRMALTVMMVITLKYSNTSLSDNRVNTLTIDSKSVIWVGTEMASDIDHYLSQGFNHYIAKPFRFEDIYDCIQQLLNVEFEYLYTPKKPLKSKLPEVDLTAPFLPSRLLLALHTAAGDYEITKLEICLTEISAINEQAKLYADHLKQYISNYDMDGLMTCLGRAKINQTE